MSEIELKQIEPGQKASDVSKDLLYNFSKNERVGITR